VQAPERCTKRQTRHGSLRKVGDVQGYEEAGKIHGAVNGLNPSQNWILLERIRTNSID
jgi:hypothetical protein